MSKILDHRFRSSKADGPDPTQVQPSHWNDSHAFTGGAAGQVLVRDPTDLNFGAAWAQYGQWTDVPFAAANFAAQSPMVWTVGAGAIIQNRYAVYGKTIFWSIYLSWFSGNNVLSGAPAPALFLKAPGGLGIIGSQYQAVAYSAGIAGVQTVNGLYVTTDGSNNVTVLKGTGGNYAITDIPGMIFTLTLEVG